MAVLATVPDYSAAKQSLPDFAKQFEIHRGKALLQQQALPFNEHAGLWIVNQSSFSPVIPGL